MKYLGTLGLGLIYFCQSTEAQKFTTTNAQKLLIKNEDSLLSGSNAQKTVIPGHSSAFYQKNFD
jgi:hypothetical protein